MAAADTPGGSEEAPGYTGGVPGWHALLGSDTDDHADFSAITGDHADFSAITDDHADFSAIIIMTDKHIDVSGEGVYQHEIGDSDCCEGWCGGGFSYPRQCECGGLIHADFGDENSDCDYWLYTKCDKCGKSE